MLEQKVGGEIKIFNCKDIKVGLYYSDPYRWLQISGESNGNRVQQTLFFKSQQDQDAVIQQLYSEMGKLLPKF